MQTKDKRIFSISWMPERWFYIAVKFVYDLVGSRSNFTSPGSPVVKVGTQNYSVAYYSQNTSWSYENNKETTHSTQADTITPKWLTENYLCHI